MPTKLKEMLVPGEIRIGLGMRNIKTAVAVVFCLLVYEAIYMIAGFIGFDIQNLLPMQACTATIICMQNTVEQTLSNGFARIIGTFYGGVLGILLLFVSNYIPSFLQILMIAVAISLCICLCNLTGQQNACAISCVVLLTMLINKEEGSQYISALLRLIETIVGIIVAGLVNRYFFIPKWMKSLKEVLIKRFSKKEEAENVKIENVKIENVKIEKEEAEDYIMSKICVMSFNIRNACDNGTEAWESRKVNFFNLIKNVNPDLMGFQEVMHCQYVDLVENLSEYDSVGIGRDDGKNAGEYAAIFYKKARFTLIETNSFWLSETPEKPSLGWDAACIRICTYVKLYDTKTKKEFIHFNTHLDHEGQRAMLEGARLVRKAMIDKKIPAFVTGDFNVYEKSEPYNIMTQEGLSDAKFTAKSSMSYATYHGYNPSDSMKNDSPIDYLFYTDHDFQVESYSVIVNGRKGEYTSDHYPILVTLTQL